MVKVTTLVFFFFNNVISWEVNCAQTPTELLQSALTPPPQTSGIITILEIEKLLEESSL